jgi:hypothetical protein
MAKIPVVVLVVIKPAMTVLRAASGRLPQLRREYYLLDSLINNTHNTDRIDELK